MSERASQFFFTMLGFLLSLFDILFLAKQG